MVRCIKYLLSVILSITSFAGAQASHIVGGEMTYVYDGDSTSGGLIFHKYKVSLSIYEDCLNGNPTAIAQDNPAFIGIYDGNNNLVLFDTTLYYTLAITVPEGSGSSPCGSLPSSFSYCLIKKTFTKTYSLLTNSAGYTIAYQRCCRNSNIVNITDPGNTGATYTCTIPGYPLVNNSAVFRNYPPQGICRNMPLYYDNSATDADGDSLTYGFCAALNMVNTSDIKPLPAAPPYDSVGYITPTYTSQIPINGVPSLNINTATGLITGTPTLAGRYLVTVFCNEWRGGVLINTMRREYQFIVTDCEPGYVVNGNYAAALNNDTIIVAGDSIQFHATGGTSYTWTPATYLSDPTIADPVGRFPDAGNFIYTLHTKNDSGCSSTATIDVQVINYSEFLVPNAFTPNGDARNDILRPIPIFGGTLVNFKIFNRKGNIVYSGGPDSPGWDGTYKGEKQEVGTYYWEISYKDSKGNDRKEKGDVTLVR